MLHKLQQSLLQAIYHRHDDVEQLLDGQRYTAEQQMNIYRNSIFGGLLKSLTEIYPVTRRLVGEDFFDALCQRYIARIPSTKPDINDYGQSLAEFTANFPPAMSLPYLVDVMQLEWAWHWALQCKDTPIGDLHTLLDMDAETLSNITLVLPDSATLIRSAFPVLTIWQANQPAQNGNALIDLTMGGQNILVWRHKVELRMDPLEVAETDFVHAIVHLQTLGEMQALPEFNACLIATLQRGYISNYRFRTNPISN